MYNYILQRQYKEIKSKKYIDEHIKKTFDPKLFMELLKNNDYNIKMLANDQEKYVIEKSNYDIQFIFVNNITGEKYLFFECELFRLDYHYYFIDNELNPIWNSKIGFDIQTLNKEILFPIIDETFIKLCFTPIQSKIKLKIPVFIKMIFELLLFFGCVFFILYGVNSC